MRSSLGSRAGNRNRVIQGDRISVLAPLAVSVVASVCTTAIFLLPLRATIHLVRRQRSLGSIGTPWTDVAIFARVVFYASLGHLVEIGFWALLFMICREFTRLRNSLLPLSGELHFPRLRRSHHVAFLETTRSARDGEWSTPLRGFDRDDFCSHRVVDSD